MPLVVKHKVKNVLYSDLLSILSIFCDKVDQSNNVNYNLPMRHYYLASQARIELVLEKLHVYS